MALGKWEWCFILSCGYYWTHQQQEIFFSFGVLDGLYLSMTQPSVRDLSSSLVIGYGG
jgi:hypothetical protein